MFFFSEFWVYILQFSFFFFFQLHSSDFFLRIASLCLSLYPAIFFWKKREINEQLWEKMFEMWDEKSLYIEYIE